MKLFPTKIRKRSLWYLTVAAQLDITIFNLFSDTLDAVRDLNRIARPFPTVQVDRIYKKLTLEKALEK